MKKLLMIALLLLIFPVILSGCDYITGAALSETSPVPPRWAWGSANGGPMPEVIDRYTKELIKDVGPIDAFLIQGTSQFMGNPIVIDVRTPQEYANGHVWRAINIDYQSPAFKNEIGKLDKNFTYIVYCRTGYRSNLARNIMEGLGFNYVINITGGYSAWVSAGLPIEN